MCGSQNLICWISNAQALFQPLRFPGVKSCPCSPQFGAFPRLGCTWNWISRANKVTMLENICSFDYESRERARGHARKMERNKLSVTPNVQKSPGLKRPRQCLIWCCVEIWKTPSGDLDFRVNSTLSRHTVETYRNICKNTMYIEEKWGLERSSFYLV